MQKPIKTDDALPGFKYRGKPVLIWVDGYEFPYTAVFKEADIDDEEYQTATFTPCHYIGTDNEWKDHRYTVKAWMPIPEYKY